MQKIHAKMAANFLSMRAVRLCVHVKSACKTRDWHLSVVARCSSSRVVVVIVKRQQQHFSTLPLHKNLYLKRQAKIFENLGQAELLEGLLK